MKKLIFILIAIILSGNISYAQIDQNPIPDKRIAVIDKVVISGYSTSNLRNHLAARIETLLQNMGWTTLARGIKYKDLLQEQNLQGIDPRTAPQKNRIWGSTAIIKVYVEINITRTPQNNSIRIKGWGTSSSRSVYYARGVINLQVIDTQTGQTKPNILCESYKTGSIANYSYLSTPYGRINSGGGYNGNIKEMLSYAIIDELTSQAVSKLNALSFEVPSRPVMQENLLNNKLPPSIKPHDSEQLNMGFSKEKYQYDVEIEGVKGQKIEIFVFSEKNSEYKSIGSPVINSTDGIMKIKKNSIGFGKRIAVKGNNKILHGTVPCNINIK